MPNTDWKLVIHGGAGVIDRSRLTPEIERQLRAGLEAGLDAGAAILAAGGSALDAVETAARVLEDDPQFNAGRGAVYTYEGAVELDAAIMDGRTRGAGAIAGATSVKNPVTLARAVMEKSPHVFLGHQGADVFAREQGVEPAPPGWFESAQRRGQLAELKARGADWFDIDQKYGTIGVVALDADGHVAAATSTGGVTGKRWSRIGDSPVIGAGTWADDRSCAVSATGSGETFLRAAVAHQIAARIRHGGENAQEAADAALAEVKALGGQGGVIVVTPAGEAVAAFNSAGMYRGIASAAGRSVAIFGDED